MSGQDVRNSSQYDVVVVETCYLLAALLDVLILGMVCLLNWPVQIYDGLQVSGGPP